MESLIPIINKLQDVFNTIGSDGIQLPQIVVVGAQSCGKSSVLENIVGRSFLPKGTGIVTRTPLVLQLVHRPKVPGPLCREDDGTLEVDEYGVFLHSKKKFTDFQEIRSEIETQTERIAGTNKGISDQVISLKIYSPTVSNLTLVDLPGLAKIPHGDQPDNIEVKIRNLMLKYIQNQNSIIMAVVTANTDMSTSESLKLAKDSDPTGERTLIVVTKLDLMNSGTDATDILRGRVIPINLGIIGVVNRSQKDIEDKKPIPEAQKDEAKFLLIKYPSLANCNGTSYLTKRLNQLHMKHIQDYLPELKDCVESMITQHQDLIKSYDVVLEDNNEVLLKIIIQFSSAYSASITGASANLRSKTLVGGARICYILHESFKTEVNGIDPLCGIEQKDILTLMRNAAGPRPALFIPELAFEQLVKDQVGRLEGPSLRCAQLVHEEMKQMLLRCGAEIEQKFPALRNKILDLVSDLLTNRMVKVNSIIKTLIAMELSHINTRHPYFNKYRTLLRKEESQTKSDHETSNPSFEMEHLLLGNTGFNKDSLKKYDKRLAFESEEKDYVLLQKLLVSYFETARITILDIVPKSIMLLLVNFIKDNLQIELINALYRSPDTENVFHEAKHIAQEREDKTNMLKALQQASRIINETETLMCKINTSDESCAQNSSLFTFPFSRKCSPVFITWTIVIILISSYIFLCEINKKSEFQ